MTSHHEQNQEASQEEPSPPFRLRQNLQAMFFDRPSIQNEPSKGCSDHHDTTTSGVEQGSSTNSNQASSSSSSQGSLENEASSGGPVATNDGKMPSTNDPVFQAAAASVALPQSTSSNAPTAPSTTTSSTTQVFVCLRPPLQQLESQRAAAAASSSDGAWQVDSNQTALQLKQVAPAARAGGVPRCTSQPPPINTTFQVSGVLQVLPATVASNTKAPSDTYRRVGQPLVRYLLEPSATTNKSALLLTYGMTNTGKTYTLFGKGTSTAAAASKASTSHPPSLLESALADLLEKEPSKEQELQVSVVQVTGRSGVLDLLAESQETARSGVSVAAAAPNRPTKASMFQAVTSVEQGCHLVQQALQRRMTAHNGVNAVSSRSHVVVTLRLVPKSDAPTATLYLVDMAGRERSSRTGASTQVLQQETGMIHTTIMALDRCLSAIGERTRPSHSNKPPSLQLLIPYRDSKLTLLLAPHWNLYSTGVSLPMTSLLVCISPDAADVEETRPVLQTAQRWYQTLCRRRPLALQPPLLPPTATVEYDFNGRRLKRKQPGADTTTAAADPSKKQRQKPPPTRFQASKPPTATLNPALVLVADAAKEDASSSASTTNDDNVETVEEQRLLIASLQEQLSEARAECYLLEQEKAALEAQQVELESTIRQEVSEEVSEQMQALHDQYQAILQRMSISQQLPQRPVELPSLAAPKPSVAQVDPTSKSNEDNRKLASGVASSSDDSEGDSKPSPVASESNVDAITGEATKERASVERSNSNQLGAFMAVDPVEPKELSASSERTPINERRATSVRRLPPPAWGLDGDSVEKQGDKPPAQNDQESTSDKAESPELTPIHERRATRVPQPMSQPALGLDSDDSIEEKGGTKTDKDDGMECSDPQSSSGDGEDPAVAATEKKPAVAELVQEEDKCEQSEENPSVEASISKMPAQPPSASRQRRLPFGAVSDNHPKDRKGGSAASPASSSSSDMHSQAKVEWLPPKKPPKQNPKTGCYVRPKGRAPKGVDGWDAVKGQWRLSVMYE